MESALNAGAVKGLARRSRPGGTRLHSEPAVREDSLKAIAGLRKLRFKHTSLRTGSYGMAGLAMART